MATVNTVSLKLCKPCPRFAPFAGKTISSQKIFKFLASSAAKPDEIRIANDPVGLVVKPPSTEEELPLLTPYQLGEFNLSNRIVLAPLTRCRAIGRIPQQAAATYYSRMAHGNLLISEATCISDTAHGYPHTPGIYTEEQVEAWKPIVKAVHDKGSTFFCQIWHVGRISHADYQPGGAQILSSTTKPAVGDVYTEQGKAYRMEESLPPRAITKEDIAIIVQDFRVAARNAINAGFDGVEVHGAHSYLIEQFLKDGINDRTDEYGGSIENRSRFALEVVKAVADEVGADRVGIRLSPFTDFYGATDSDPYALMAYLIEELNKIGILFIHAIEPRIGSNTEVQEVDETKFTLKPFREAFKGTFIGAGGYTRENGNEAVKQNKVDLAAFGRLYLANPDLPQRFKVNAPLNNYNRATFYIQDQYEGYLDYPTLEEQA